MNNYILAIKASECKEEDKALCLLYQKYHKCRIDTLCKRVSMLNPLCFADKCRSSYGTRIDIFTIDGEKYILYKCNNQCSQFLNINMEKFLKSLDRKDIIYGNELVTLLKKINIEPPKSPNTDLDLQYLKVLISYMKEDNVQ